jgi:hypothetical protein
MLRDTVQYWKKAYLEARISGYQEGLEEAKRVAAAEELIP